ncbi:MAG: hypothetical protein COA49_09720 [Bacteroidetes bacterium]|nr:MAG: hypothetical protein COA49_09720 [Bacteroidota bacterium]
MKNVFLFSVIAVFSSVYTALGQSYANEATYEIAVLQYRGGGDWYSNPTSLPNLVEFCNSELGMNISPEVPYVEVSSSDLSLYPFVHMTGHGNVVFSTAEAKNIRRYLIAGGFLHISDNYGLDAYVRKEFVKVFPELDWIEIPFNHAVYHQTFDFDSGLPKIHEHDNLPPRGLGLFHNGRLVCFYDTECDLGDGWEDFQVHRDPESVRLAALQMGANLIQFAMGGEVE